MRHWNANVGCFSGADADADAPKPDVSEASREIGGIGLGVVRF